MSKKQIVKKMFRGWQGGTVCLQETKIGGMNKYSVKCFWGVSFYRVGSFRCMWCSGWDFFFFLKILRY